MSDDGMKQVTHRVFFDVEIDGMPAGMCCIEVFDEILRCLMRLGTWGDDKKGYMWLLLCAEIFAQICFLGAF